MRSLARGVSVVEFMIWLMLVGIVVGSTLTWYRRAQERAAALEVQQLLDHLVTKTRDEFAGKDAYFTISRAYMIFWHGYTLEDFTSREYGLFNISRTILHVGDGGMGFRVTAPYIPQREVCSDVVRMSVETLKPLRIFRNNVVVVNYGDVVTPAQAAALACDGTQDGRVAWDFM